jgi:hypothetical protein
MGERYVRNILFKIASSLFLFSFILPFLALGFLLNYTYFLLFN